MRFSTAAFLVSAAAVASAANVTVLVGDGGLVFNPTSVNVNAGDTINFEFRAKNHSVTQSTFANPCAKQTTPAPGIDSGFQPVAAGATTFPTWSITIQNASAPLWFYCAQTAPANHCNAGMVFAVNPTAEKSFDAFQAAAKAAGGSTPGGGYGAPGGGYGAPGAGGSGAGGSGTTGAATGTKGTGAPAATETKSNGAPRLGGNAVGVILAGAGLLAGLVL